MTERALPERAALVFGYAAALSAALYTSSMLLGQGFLSEIGQMPILSDLAQASIWTLFVMVPAGVKHLSWEDRDELLVEMRASQQGLSARHHRALSVGAETYESILKEIAREESASIRERSASIAEQVGRGFLALTRRADELQRAIERTQARPLEVRARSLEERVRATRDVALKRELLAALSEVVEQMRTRQRLETACARIEARQQRYLTALDKLHVTLLQNDSLSSTEGALIHSLDELTDLTEQVRWQNLSVEELLDAQLEAPGSDRQEAAEVDELTEQALGALMGEIHQLSGYTSSSAARERDASSLESRVSLSDPIMNEEEPSEQAEQVEAVSRHPG